MNTYVAIVDKKTKMVVGAELMLQSTFDRLEAEDGFTVYKDTFGNVMIRLVN